MVALEHTSAVIGLGDENLLDVASGDIGVAHAGFVTAELPILDIDTGWFAGARWGYVGAQVPGRPSHTFAASPEIWWRIAAVGDSGVAVGAKLGVVLPIARDFAEDELASLRSARVVRPADDVLLRDRSPAMRPAFDLRWSQGQLVLQFQQGMDISYQARAEGRLDLVATSAAFVGFRPDEQVLIGAEVRDVYVLTEDLDDAARAAVSLSPGVRVRMGRVAPAVSVELPLATPLGGEARAFVAVQLGVEIELGDAGAGSARDD